MSDLSDFLAADSVDAAMTVANKKALFQQLAAAASRKTGIPTKALVASLNERERLGSTGFGGGTAIPHGKIEGLDHMFGFFARLTAPIEFQAVDTLPVDNPPIVAETRVDIPDASVSDAVMLLDLRNTNALLFRNSGTGKFNMVYRRGDGTIGWVEPQRD